MKSTHDNELFLSTTDQLNSQQNNINRIEGFDYLRAISCIFVVAFHANPFPKGSILEKISVLILGSAVPIFILISLFLTELKINKKNYIFIKSYRLLKIYFFWGFFYPLLIFLTFDYSKGTYLFNLNDIISSVFNLNIVFRYLSFLSFVVILFFLIWIYFIFIKPINNYFHLILIFMIFSLFNFAIPLLPDNLYHFRNVAKHPLGLLAFFIYLPMAKILVYDYQQSRKNLQKKLFFALISYFIIVSMEVILQLLDGRFGVPEFHYSLYGRLSVTLLAISFMYASFLIQKPLESFSFLLNIINKCSLGIFLIHGYIIIGDNMNQLQRPMRFLVTLSVSTIISLLLYDLPILKKTIRL